MVRQLGDKEWRESNYGSIEEVLSNGSPKHEITEQEADQILGIEEKKPAVRYFVLSHLHDSKEGWKLVKCSSIRTI